MYSQFILLLLLLLSTVAADTGDDYIDQSKLPTWRQNFVTAMLKGRPCEFSLKRGDAQMGSLTTLYDGVRPQHGNCEYGAASTLSVSNE